MGPVGIIPTLVIAIRVSGPQWLKTLIGRARESVSAAEVDLMSSTSSEVCELYNGKAIVRTTGKAMMVKQLIYIEKQSEGKELGLVTFATRGEYLKKEVCRNKLPTLTAVQVLTIGRSSRLAHLARVDSYQVLPHSQ